MIASYSKLVERNERELRREKEHAEKPLLNKLDSRCAQAALDRWPHKT